ncbi:TonB-dependent receptor [Aureispira anguillae]|uniref:TonB-dependent receptor n=1 Tax=Aureispira anguillae TaxID=2864201 RepID=A0A915YFI6_9BACT|nr:TonB-dependent receptor [Aureispira anguillae]BDS12090.1 TonB-dependent receptor [Aureispira anguillae]
MKTIASIATLFFLLPLFSIAQTGSISGTVIDGESKEPIMFGNVVIESTGQGVSTDMDGKYIIADLKAGTYSIKFSYLGLKDKLIENIEVKAGESTVVDVKMGEDPVVLELNATVSAERITNTETAVLSMKKESTAVLDGVSAKEISKSGDNDAAAAVKRISGVTVEGGKYVYVRGLGDRYGKTTLNGADIPGLDPNKNTVQMDLFPTNLLDNILVYKTFTPNLPGDFTGGYIDVVTKNFPSSFTINAGASMSYNTQTTFNKNFLTQQRGSTDWLGFDDGTRALPATITQSGEIPNLQNNNAANFDFDGAQRLVDMTHSFSNTWQQIRQSVPFNHSFSFGIGNKFKFENQTELGVIGALSYNRNYSFYENGTYGIYQLTGMYDNINTLTSNLALKDTKGVDDVLWGGMVNIAYKIKASHTFNFMVMHNQSATTTSRYLEGTKDDDKDELFQTQSSRFLQRGLTTFQLGGKHTFLKFKNFEVNWKSSFARSTQKDPDLRYFTNRYDEEYDLYRIKPSSDRTPSRFYRNMAQGNWSNKIDFVLPLIHWSDAVKDKIKLKAGFAHAAKNRTFQENRYSFENQQINFNGDLTTYFAPNNLISISETGSKYANNGNGVYIENALDSANIYDASQSLYAGYGMIELPIVSGLNLITGARIEYTSVRLKTYSHKVLTAYPELDGIQNILSNLDVLPAVSLNYEPTKKMKIRAAYSRTLARPSFRELAPFTSFDVEGGYAFVGNPSLQRTITDNADLRWEFYPTNKELISVSAFYKNFTNPIERTFNPKALNPEITYRNVDNAYLAGVELEVRKNLGFISPVLENLQIGANFSYIYSQTTIDAEELKAIRAEHPNAPSTREMYGQSPYSVNGLLSYKNDSLGLTANVVFNVSGPKISFISIGGTPNTYVQPRPSLNINISKKLVKGLSIKVSASNILMSPYRESIEFKGKTYDVSYYEPGMNFSLGIKYNFEKQ